MMGNPKEAPALPLAHAVQFYENDLFLAHAVAKFLADGLSRAEPALVVATEPHRAAFASALAEMGIDVDAATASGQLLMLDAAETLAQLMVDGRPDAERFDRVVGGTIRRRVGEHGGRPLRAYGEMVDLLWREGERSAALLLEELWNDLGARESFSLLCAYVMGNFYKRSDGEAFALVCDAHSHVFPTEKSPALDDVDALRRQLGGLQQRNVALEKEILHRRELESALREALRERDDAQRQRRDAMDKGRVYESRAELLMRVSAMLSDAIEYGPTLRRVAEIAVPALADWCAIVVRNPDGSMQRAAVVHKDASLAAVAREYEGPCQRPLDRESSLTAIALEAGEPKHFADLSDEDLQAGADDERQLQMLRALGCASCVVAPMLAHGEAVGWMWLAFADSTRRFGPADVAIIAELALRAAVSVENALLYRQAKEREADQRRQAERRFDLLVESIRDYAVFMLTPTGHIATWNPGAERIKGYVASEIVGKHFSTFYPAEDVNAGKCEYELAEATREGRFEDIGWRVRKDGSLFWANVVISAIRDESGDLVGFAKVTRDLSERKRAEEAEQARRIAEEANPAKDEFLAMLGHELRNPLSPIVTALQLMKLRGGSERFAKEQQIIERQVQHMVRLVDDLLDVSRITKGKIELRRQRLDLCGVVAKAIEIASPLLEQRRHHFNVDVPAEPIFVDGDEARLAQVFANLLTNAAKYTEAGGHIDVVVRNLAGEAIVQVRDDGVGLAAELLPRMFDLFVQGPQTIERSVGGLGIGLSLVRSLVRLHGGEVTAASDGPGQGSTFTVRLAVAEPPVEAGAPQPRRPAPNKKPSRRVLIVDDNEDALELLAELLRAQGHEVRTATDGASALTILRQAKPEVAILDIGLPVMDGYELAQQIRAELADGAPRLIALTGYGQQTDRARSEEAGFAAHLVRPVDVELLQRYVLSL
ncbi:MAG TPA: ATP-binding protein [Polyangia bacterium]|jgi:PAS domain S-box-containing protein